MERDGGIDLPDWFWLGVLLYNGLVFLIYVVDKLRAQRGRWRISEATLLWVALLGGGAGGVLGVYLIRHKTRKPRFAVGLPLILVAQAALLVWWLRR